MKLSFTHLAQILALLLLGVMSLSFLAIAESTQPEFGAAVVGGTGCANGAEAKITTSSDSIDFSLNLRAQSTNGELVRVACTAALPIKIPKQKRLIVLPLFFDGEEKITPGNRSSAQFSTYFSGAVETTQKHGAGKSPTQERQPFHQIFPSNTKIASPCGSDVILNLKASAYTSKLGDLRIHRAQVSYKLEDCK